MAKSATNGKITLADLAGMVQRGFADVYARMDKGFEESKQRDTFLQRQVDVVSGDVTDIKKVVKRLPTQKEFVALKKRVYVLEQTIRV